MTTRTGTRSSDASRLTDAVQGVASQAEQTVEAKASTTMDQLGDTVGGIAHAIRRAGEDLRVEQPQMASAADTAADQVERLSHYLRDREPREVFEQVEDAARRQPALVIAGGLAVGLVLGRLLRTAAPSIEAAASPRERDRRTPYGYEGRVSSMAGSENGGSTDTGDPSASIVSGSHVVGSGGVQTGTPRTTRSGR